MTNEEKIISMLEDIQKDVSDIKANFEEKHRKKSREDFFKALDNFSRVDTPEDKAEVDAFLAFMNAEEERKRAKYALLS